MTFTHNSTGAPTNLSGPQRRLRATPMSHRGRLDDDRHIAQPPRVRDSRPSYDELAAALRERGYDVAVEHPGGGVEQRGLPSDVVQSAYDVALFLGEDLGSEIVAAIVALTVDRLRRRTKRTRNGVIYGPRGETLRTFHLPPQDDD